MGVEQALGQGGGGEAIERRRPGSIAGQDGGGAVGFTLDEGDLAGLAERPTVGDQPDEVRTVGLDDDDAAPGPAEPDLGGAEATGIVPSADDDPPAQLIGFERVVAGAGDPALQRRVGRRHDGTLGVVHGDADEARHIAPQGAQVGVAADPRALDQRGPDFGVAGEQAGHVGVSLDEPLELAQVGRGEGIEAIERVAGGLGPLAGVGGAGDDEHRCDRSEHHGEDHLGANADPPAVGGRPVASCHRSLPSTLQEFPPNRLCVDPA